MELLVTTTPPLRYDQAQPTPIIVCMDGLWTAGAMADAVRIMSMPGEAPEAIVVGLSFAEPRMGEYMRQRARWFSPTAWEPPEASGVKNIEASECGRAAEHMRFVADQLLPKLASDHSISDRWFFGHSFSALFGLCMLFDTPTLFDKWVLASPSIWWGNKAILDLEQQYADVNQDLPASIFMSAGELETDSILLADLVKQQPGAYSSEELAQLDGLFNMVSNAADLETRLSGRSYPGLTVTNKVLAGESHTSTVGSAISSGLRTLHC